MIKLWNKNQMLPDDAQSYIKFFWPPNLIAIFVNNLRKQ